MKRARWKVGRSYRRRLWSRGWWLGFVWGLLLVLLVKGAVYMMKPERPEAKGPAANGAVMQSESAPAEADNMELPRKAVNGADAAETGEAAGKDAANDGVQAASGSAADKREQAVSAYDRLRVSVYLTEKKRIEKLPIELYVRGVLAGEMPVDFEPEALKAQAIAARTFIYRRLLTGDQTGLTESEKAKGADVDDTVMTQAYVPLGELLDRWSGAEKEAKLQKLNEAVEATKGLIVTYEGEPIQASFFSTSNGYTENASDYWNVDLPYLRSVASPWDKTLSPRYEEQVTLKLKDVGKKLGVKTAEVRGMRVLDTTAGDRVKAVRVGGETFTGREIREKLSLASSDFTWSIDGNEVTFATKGYGHGVGMSQWGADGMAENGATAREILAHYYTGTKLETASGILD